MLLPKPKYNIINAMLQKENLVTLKVGELVGEIRAHEIGILGMSEEPTSSKSIALKTKVNKHRKLKMIKQESSSSNEEEDHHESSSDDEDDGELALMMRKFTRLSDKINKKGYNFDPKRRMFRPREDVKYKTCYNCGEKGHISPDCPKPDKRKKETKANIAMIQAMMKRMRRKTRTRSLGRRRAMTKRPSSYQRRKGTPREASWWKNKNG